MSSNSIIPHQDTGKQNDLNHTIILDDRGTAQDSFKRAYKRLQNPSVWHELCGVLSAKLALFDAAGQPADRLATLGDYMRIDIPGPGSRLGGGFDWVRVDAIEDKTDPSSEHEYFAMRLRPAANPNNANSDTAHFFKDAASSNFIIERNGNAITASYHGRNESPNANTTSKIDNVRNTIITSGAFAGLSELQWKALIKALLEAEIGA